MPGRDRGLRISRDKLVGLVVALACLTFSAVGLRVNEVPDYFYVDGVRGEVIDIEQAELTVGEVQVGTALLRRGEVQARTGGMFVAVTVTLAVPGPQRVILNGSNLLTDDRTYDQWTSGSPRAEPGFATTEQLVFEVDPAHIDDLTLEIYYAALVSGYYSRARVHLGITAENAEQWRQAAVDRQLEYQFSGTSEALS